MSDGFDHHTHQQFEEARKRNDDMTAEFEHEAAEDCLSLAQAVTRAIDAWGFQRVQNALSAMGYELKAK